MEKVPDNVSKILLDAKDLKKYFKKRERKFGKPNSLREV